LEKIRKPKNIQILEHLEKEYNVVETFKYHTSTAWINIKNLIYIKSINFNFPIKNKKSKKMKILYFFMLSLKNLFLRKEGVLFVGAGSGIIKFRDFDVDIYKFPVKEENIIYFSSITNLDKMWKLRNYYKENNIIVHSLLFSIFRNLIAKIIKNKIKLNVSEILDFLNENNIKIKKEDIKYIYAKFIVGYQIYNLLFKFLKVKKAYVVSAYTNTEIIAALKKRNIKVIEIQHGIIGEMHRGYNYKVKSSLLPTPDKILVYDDFWKRELIDAGYFNEDQIEICGKYQYSELKDIQIFDKPFIVFTGQGIKQNEIKKFFKNAEEYLKKKDIYLIYLPHPAEENIFKIDSEYVKIIKNKEYLTEQYIKSALAHISIYSSCHFDAIYFHGKTYVFDVMEDNIMNYYKNKYPEKVIFIRNIEELDSET